MSPPAVQSTLRLQLHRGFPFAAAMARVPYFARLGISHLYLSPILTARAGSMHGYDVVDPHNVNPELGGEDGLRELVAALRMHDMGLIVDIVPNHMAVGHDDNRAWLDVLEWGPLSRHAGFFDIDWDVPDPALNGRLLAPFLGKPYGEALADGELRLQFDPGHGRFHVLYFEHRFPIAPDSYRRLLRLGSDRLREHATRFQQTARVSRGNRGDAFEQTCEALRDEVAGDPTLAADIDALLERFDATSNDGRQALHRLLERQHYRLAWWRTAPDEINWRRFFDIIDLAGVRVQEPAAFELQHGTIFRLYAEGLIDGVRVDHVDGLADPRSYCRRLRMRLSRLQHERPPELRQPPYLVVEKILAAWEHLPRDWQTDGTTGYSFMNEVGALLHDSSGEPALTELWSGIAGPRGDFEQQERDARRRIPKDLLASDFNACALALHAIARSEPATRDWTLFAIRRVLTELLVHLPVYRTYADARGRSAHDAATMARTVQAARSHCRAAERPLLDLIDRWLGGEPPRRLRSIRARRARLRAIGRFQQLSAPVAAKAVEDTVFYRHGRLLSRNEVGANPAQFALGADAFHNEMRRRAAQFPRSMLTTATHDHKRGEDVRARLAVLSEQPAPWTDAVQRWRAAHEPLKTLVDGVAAPDPIDQYMLYQILLGAWPPLLAVDDAAGLQAFAERVAGWQIKALREAKRHSSWAEPNERYESACAGFLAALLDPRRAADFVAELHVLVERIAPAGIVNSLAQVTIRLAAPGVCDLYQGGEWWDFSLVDPDNRRPVDYDARAHALDADAETAVGALLDGWRDGRIKQRLIERGLGLRRRCPSLFVGGQYRPLRAAGAHAERLFGFIRHTEQQALLVVSARHASALVAGGPRIDPSAWRGTTLRLPRFLQQRRWRSVFVDPMTPIEATSVLPLERVLTPLPVQWLLAD